MKIEIRNSALQTVIITVIITLVVFIAILILTGWFGVSYFLNSTIDELTGAVKETCVADNLSYRGSVYVPDDLAQLKAEGRLYQKPLATILWDIGGAVGSSNCRDTIPTPPPFDQQWKMVASPSSGILNNSHPATIGYIFKQSSTGMTCFTFAGTYDGVQWRDNLKIRLEKTGVLRGSLPDTQIHSGFLETYLSVRPFLWDWWSKNGGNVKKLVITGRSLGGALSTIAAYDFALLPGVDMIHYAFANPRAGNVTFATAFNKRVPYSVRVYNTEDIVPNVPPAVFRGNVYMHAGSADDAKEFTVNTESIVDNHIESYRYLPD